MTAPMSDDVTRLHQLAIDTKDDVVAGMLHRVAAALPYLAATVADREQEIAQLKSDRAMVEAYIAERERVLVSLASANAEIARLKTDWNLAASVAMKADERADDLMRDVSDLCAKLDVAREQWADALTRKERSEGSLKVQLERAEAELRVAREEHAVCAKQFVDMKVYAEQCEDKIERAEAAAEANAKDAERYRFIRADYMQPNSIAATRYDWIPSGIQRFLSLSLDREVDSAIAARASAKDCDHAWEPRCSRRLDGDMTDDWEHCIKCGAER